MTTGAALVEAINAKPTDQMLRVAFEDWCQEQGKTSGILRRYYVVTPEYARGGGYDEPPEYGADVIEVEARTKKEAIRIGVKAMLNSRGKRYCWVHDQRGDKQNPFSGVKAYEISEK